MTIDTRTVRECHCTVCGIDYISATYRCPSCNRSWDQLAHRFAFQTEAAEAAWLAEQQPTATVEVEAVEAPTLVLTVAHEQDTFTLGISGVELAAHIGWGAIKWDNNWYAVADGKFTGDFHYMQAAALGFTALYAHRAGYKVSL